MPKGKRISSLKALFEAGLSAKSVICPDADNRPMPAAFLLSMQGIIIHRRIQKGLFIYRRQKKRQPFPRKVKVFDASGRVVSTAVIQL